MASKNKPFTVTPRDGGRLMSRRSHEQAGYANYVTKRDFRRDLDQEIRAEGHVHFQTDFSALGDQAFPQRQGGAETFNPIILTHQARRPNGQTAVIAGTADALYRFHSSGDSDYVGLGSGGAYAVEDYVSTDYWIEAGDGLYMEDGYIANDDGSWTVIKSGLLDGSRWEAVNINGWANFNNGVDLPLTYRVEHGTARPNYEMREAGIARVGTIDETHGILVVGDIWTFKPDRLAATMAHHDSGDVEVRQHGAFISAPFTVEKHNVGVAVRYDGAGEYITVAPGTGLNLQADMTLEALVKFDEWTDAVGTVIVLLNSNHIAATTCYRMWLFKDADGLIRLRGSTDTESPTNVVTSTSALAAGQWHHVAFRQTNYSGPPALALFINGVASGVTTGVSTIIPVVAANWRIGTTEFGDCPPFELAEARLWNVARTDDLIRDNRFADITGQTGLVGWFKLDEGSGTSTADASPSANTGTFNGALAWVAAESPDNAFIKVKASSASVNGLTRSGATATFTCTSAHKLNTGQLVVTSGASDAAYNGVFTVTVVDAITFQYTVAGTPASPDPGSPKVQRALFGASGFDYAGLEGKQMFLLDGFTATIEEVIDSVMVRVGRSTASITGDHLFQIRTLEAAALTGTVEKDGTTTVYGTGTSFTTELFPGCSLLIPGTQDEVRVVSSIASDTELEVTDAYTHSSIGETAQIIPENQLLTEFSYFDVSMIGQHLFTDDGDYRLITGVIDARRAETNDWLALAAQEFERENLDAYEAVTDSSILDRIQYRRAWSDIDAPLRWSASTPCSMVSGSKVLRAAYQMRSIEVGDSLLVIGAGTAGGNLTASVLWVHPDRRTFFMDTAAATTVTEDLGLVSQKDAANSVSGYEDLQDDGSAIVKMKDLDGVQVTFKDTAIFLSAYTGNVDAPFQTSRVTWDEGMRPLFYRNTLARSGRMLIYAGMDEFYSFDLTSRQPRIFEPLLDCKEVFFSQAKLENTNLIFAGSNHLTNEIFFCFPSTSEDKALVFDSKWGTQRTTGAAYTSMASIKRPQSDMATTVTEDWCIMGTSDGMVLRYGLSNQPQAEWGGANAVLSRLGSGYESRMKSGLVGDRFHEIDISEWMAELATQDYPTVTQYTFNLYGWRSPSDQPPKTLVSRVMTVPNKSPVRPVFFKKHFFQDEIVVSGVNNPLRISSRTIATSRVFSRAQGKSGQQP